MYFLETLLHHKVFRFQTGSKKNKNKNSELFNQLLSPKIILIIQYGKIGMILMNVRIVFQKKLHLQHSKAAYL